MLIDEECDLVGGVSWSKLENDGATNESPSALALSLNLTGNLSPIVTNIGASVLNDTAPPAHATNVVHSVITMIRNFFSNLIAKL
jgi:hypothetical protein